MARAGPLSKIEPALQYFRHPVCRFNEHDGSRRGIKDFFS
jgi:hypothetical protein